MSFLGKNKSFIKEIFMIFFIGILINLFCFFIYFVPVHAETYDNTLPFKFSGIDNFNSFLNDDLLDYIDDQGLPVYDENYILILRDISYQSANPIGYRFYFDLLPISTFTSYTDDIYNTSVSFSIDSNKTKHRFYVGTLFTWNGSELVPYQYGVAGKSTSFTVSYNMFGRAPTSYTAGETGKKPNWTTTYFYPCYFSKNFYFNNNVVLEFTSGSSVGTGHATPPDTFENPVINSGSNHTLPREVPESPTINNYTWITYNPPTIDTTNLESLLESLIYVINYLAGWIRDNLSGEFQNLISNITGLFNYIGETIQYYCGLIISNIQNGIETFYNNMVSLFEPILNIINYISEPISGTVIYDNISTTSLVSNISTIQTSLTSFQASFTGVDEPLSYSIPIHLENLPSNWFGTQTTQYIDLGVINGTVKDGLRLFVWAMVTYSLVVTIFDSISNYINGGGDES